MKHLVNSCHLVEADERDTHDAHVGNTGRMNAKYAETHYRTEYLSR